MMAGAAGAGPCGPPLRPRTRSVRGSHLRTRSGRTAMSIVKRSDNVSSSSGAACVRIVTIRSGIVVDAVGTTKYIYTKAAQLLTEDGPFTSDAVTNTYASRLRTALALQQPTGSWTNGFIYDAARRCTNAISPAGL